MHGKSASRTVSFVCRSFSLPPALRPIVFLIVFIPTLTFSNTATISVKEAGKIIVLENGRKKPLDTYARNKLMQFSGKRRYARKSALLWLTRLMFDPVRGDFDKIFLINNPEIANTLGIPPQRKRRYSYAVLSQAAEQIQRYYNSAAKKTGKERSEFENEITRIYGNLLEYRSLASMFSFTEENRNFHVAHSDSTATLPPIFTNPHRSPSFFELLQQRSYLSKEMNRIQKLPPDSLTFADKVIVAITKHMYEINKSISNTPPHIIPVVEKGEETWYSPLGYIGLPRGSAVTNPIIQSLLQLRKAYRTNNQKAFDDAVASINKSARSINLQTRLPDPSLELLYNRLSPFFFAKIFLGLAALFVLIALFSSRPFVSLFSLAGIITAFVLCTAGIILRVLIMRHPPVTNLYETFIFVGWSTIIIGFILEYMRIRPIGILTASLAGFIFLHVAGRYAADGDTLGMLAAILDSGFWLTTHIITVALGYAGCLGAGFIGHIYLIQRSLFPQKQQQLTAISRAVYGVFAFGMLFTVIGTVTGGMWADQAWGRFWGWDPKENGALLIILWSMIVFHIRLTRLVADIGLAVGAIIAAILVMFSWIGVNLLGTGLHSYGFTSSGARMLFGYTGFEVLFMIVFGFLIWAKRRKR